MAGYQSDETETPQRGFKYQSQSNSTLDTFFEGIDDGLADFQDPLEYYGLKEQQTEDIPRTSIMFTHRDELPRLPIPSLEETAQKFMASLEALQTTEEKAITQQTILDFFGKDGCAPRLQELLKEYEQSGIDEGILGSYVEEFWNDSNLSSQPASQTAGSNGDDPPLPQDPQWNNPFFLLEDAPDPKVAKNPIRRAANLTLATIKLAATISDESFPPETARDQQPLCMDQYKAVFGTARVPQPFPTRPEVTSTSTTTATTSSSIDDIDVYPYSTHVVVMCRNQFFYFQAMWPDTGVVAVDEEDLVDILTIIDRNSNRSTVSAEKMTDSSSSQPTKDVPTATVPAVGPGVWTTLPRREWGGIRKTLTQSDPRNKHYLTILDSALFVLVLDLDIFPESVDAAAANLWHGTTPLPTDTPQQQRQQQQSQPQPQQAPLMSSCGNRWYDKLQLIVCGDGTAGMNFEHSAIDGHTALRIVSDIYAETVVNFAQSITRNLPSNGKLSHVIDAPIERAGMMAMAPRGGGGGGGGDIITDTLPNLSMASHDSQKFELDVWPKKISLEIPPTLQRQLVHAQTALEDTIAASDLHTMAFPDYGKLLVVANNLSPDAYCQMAILLTYYQMYGKVVGVYEPILTKQFYHGRTEAMRSATRPAQDLCECFFDPKVQLMTKWSVMKRAIQRHAGLVQECANGKGVDRHLYALKCIAEKSNSPVPDFFESDAWKLLNQSILACSNCGNPSLRLFGLSPIVTEGGFGIGYIIKDQSIHFCVTSKTRPTQRFVRALHIVLTEMAKLLPSPRRTSMRSRGPVARTRRHMASMTNSATLTASDQITRETRESGAVDYDMWGQGKGPSPTTPTTTTTTTTSKAVDMPPTMTSMRAPGAQANLTPVTSKNVSECDEYHPMPPNSATSRRGGRDQGRSDHTPLVANRQPSRSRGLASPGSGGGEDDPVQGSYSWDKPLVAPSQAINSDTDRTAPSRPTPRRSAPAGIASLSLLLADTLPMKPQRRGSMLSGMSQRRSLSMAQLQASGTSLDF